MAAQALRDDMLMKGITTVRDIVGNSRGIANAIKKNLLIGPRLYTSGGVLSHTGGHGDWGAKNDAEPSDYGVLIQQSYIVDGREDVIRASRRNYRVAVRIVAGQDVQHQGSLSAIAGPNQFARQSATPLVVFFMHELWPEKLDQLFAVSRQC